MLEPVSCSLSQRFGRLRQCFDNNPERARLDAAIKEAKIALLQVDTDNRKSWWRSAEQHLEQARIYLGKGNLHQGWCSLNLANRLMLLGECDDQAKLVAIELLEETKKKLTGWRADAIIKLIGENGKPEGATLRKRVARAMAIRDSQFETDYFKILLRRRHLKQIIGLLFIFILLTLVLCHYYLPAPFNDWMRIAAVLLFGAIGAAVSVAAGLMKADLSAKIPMQKLGSFVVWVRPVVGAAAALIAFLLLNAKAIRLFDWEPTDLTAILTVATVAGFSERFILGAIEKIGDKN